MFVIFHDVGITPGIIPGRSYLKKNTKSLFNPKLSLAHIFLTHEDAVKANMSDLWIKEISKKELFEARLKGI